MKSSILKNIILLSCFSCSSLLAITIAKSPEPEKFSCNQFTNPEKCNSASTYCKWDYTSERCVEMINEE